EYDVMNFGMAWAIAFAIKAVGIGPGIFFRELHLRCLVKLRIDAQELAGPRLPRLMAEQIDQRNDADLMLLADLGYLAGLGARQSVRIGQFRTAGELKIVIHAQDENVGRARRQIFANEFNELIDTIAGRGSDAKPTHRQGFIRTRLGGSWAERPKEQEETQVIPGIHSLVGLGFARLATQHDDKLEPTRQYSGEGRREEAGWTGSTKHQHPSTREAPKLKLQTPNSKLQRNFKHQAPSSNVGHWRFEFEVSLEFGV